MKNCFWVIWHCMSGRTDFVQKSGEEMSMKREYYFDNNATTCPSKNVTRAMARTSVYVYGNPSSIYSLGNEARKAVEEARESVARLFDGDMGRIIFTSGATEANNAVIRSALLQNVGRKKILVSSVEHPSVRECVNYYKRYGYEVIRIPVTEEGIDLESIRNVLDGNVALVSCMAVNNETGMIFPVDEIFQMVKQYDPKIVCHSDCVQAVGKTDLPVKYSDYLTISAHKFHGPKGVGCIYRKMNMDFHPFLYGGGQEVGNRSGTENTIGIVGLGTAAGEVQDSLDCRERLRMLQEHLEEALSDMDSYVVCKHIERVPGVTNVGFRGVEANRLLLALNRKRIFVSTGSACSSGKIGNSEVIEELNVPENYRSTVRISMSRYTDNEEVDYLIENIADAVNRLRLGY